MVQEVLVNVTSLTKINNCNNKSIRMFFDVCRPEF